MSGRFTPTFHMCSGIVTSKLANSTSWEVSVYHSPLGQLMGPVYAGLICPPGMEDNIKQGDHVKIGLHFTHADDKVIDIYKDGQGWIFGKFEERAFLQQKVENTLTKSESNNIGLTHPTSKAGYTCDAFGEARTSSAANFSTLKGYGVGTHENEHYTHAQNHHRVIARANAPLYLTREYFGMFKGAAPDDRSAREHPQDYPIGYKRFVQQCLDVDRWVSTCEGAWNPWVGPNNGIDYSGIHKEILLSKVINHDDSRIIIEMGQPGKEFINIRVDDVLTKEEKASSEIGASTSSNGNRLKLNISDQGAVTLYAGGAGQNGNNQYKFKFSVDLNGNLTINSAGTMTLTHGDGDVGNNSIVLDPANGINITAKKGLKVNGKNLVNENFLTWFYNNRSVIFQAVALGAPAPMFEPISAILQTNTSSVDEGTGFTTKDAGANASLTISNADSYTSI